MPRLTNTAPNRFNLVSDSYVVSKEPLVAVVMMDTDDGTVELAFNRAGAEHLIEELQKLLKS